MPCVIDRYYDKAKAIIYDVGKTRSVAQSKILFRKGQSMTSSVTDIALSPTVPSVYFQTVEN